MLMSREVLLGSVCLLASFASAAFAQTPRPLHSGHNNASPEIERNVYDPGEAVVAATTTQVTGKFVANFTIKLVTPVPSGSEVVRIKRQYGRNQLHHPHAHKRDF
jgi:hypothetical protein